MLKFLVWFPIYWLCVVISNLVWMIGAISGAIIGMLLFWAVFPLPPRTTAQGLLMMTLMIFLGIFTANRIAPKFREILLAVRRRIEREF